MTLQEQSENIITRLGLLDKLAQFGEVHVVGNVAFGTTTKPDIDVQIYSDMHYEEAATDIIRVFMELGITDIKERRLKRSKKYLVIGEYLSEGMKWAIDITLTQPSKHYLKDSYQFYLDYFPKMTDEKHDQIMKFKGEFAHDKISGDNSSYYIYLGVLDNDIKTTNEMKKYLNRMRENR